MAQLIKLGMIAYLSDVFIFIFVGDIVRIKVERD